MSKPDGLSKRELLRWAALGTGAAALGTLGLAPLRSVNSVLLAAEAKSSGCRKDVCRTEDAPDSTCEKRDVCDIDTSGHCRVDVCEADSSGECTEDTCTSDKSAGCTGDACAADSSGGCEGDACDSDSSGDCGDDACVEDASGECTGDACDADSSKECLGDTCVADSSGECDQDDCVADSSGDCDLDDCLSDQSGGCDSDGCELDSSGECVEDACASDSSGGCENDACASDSSGACTDDVCTIDSSKGCTRDTCGEDASGANDGGTQECDIDASDDCFEDRCVSDYSGSCFRDLCVHDTSGPCDVDQCREDSSPDRCVTRDVCAQDVAMGPLLRRRSLGPAKIGRALRWLYEGTAVVALAVGLAASARADTAVDASNAIFSPDPVFVTGGQVDVSAPVGPFLRDADADGVLEADTNGDGSAEGDPEVKDWDGDGTRELPPGTAFTGTFEFTCFYVPSDVRIESTGPLTIRASLEVAVFGAMTLRSGASIATPGRLDLFSSVWLSEDGSPVTFTTSEAGDVDRSRAGLPRDAPPGPVVFTQLCDVDEPAIRAVSPAAGTDGTVITIRGAHLGTKKGRVRIGKARVQVVSWLPERVTCRIKKARKKAIGLQDVVVRPKGAKRAEQITFPASFDVRAPAVHYVDRSEAPTGAEVGVVGEFLGTKRGRITVGKKKAKVLGWEMANATGRSLVVFVVPKKLDGDTTYPTTVRTKTGTAAFDLRVLPPLVVDDE